MLVFSLEKNEAVVLDGCIVVKVLKIQGDEVRLEIERPEGVSVRCGEAADAACTETDFQLQSERRNERAWITAP
jgi:carbon storage regulator CsrA